MYLAVHNVGGQEAPIDHTLAKNLKAAVKEALGTCVSLGVTVDDKDAREVQQEIEKGAHDEELK